jgi:hypothetical protein
MSPQPGQSPICLIDFGLVRIYRDQRTGEHERARPRTGFRGTKTYASLNAHAYTDLSRRDDLASWFYVLVDSLTGGLPWKGVTNNIDVAVMKNQFDMRAAVDRFAPRLYEIWLHITHLRFESDPDYRLIMARLDELVAERNIGDNDPYDWADIMVEYRRTLSTEFGFADRPQESGRYYSELGLPPALVQQLGRKEIRQPLVPGQARNFSLMQASELNEGAAQQCCC